MLSICARGMVDDLLGFKQLRGGYTGVFGNVRGYLASVTSKGQGKVAMNLVVWLMRSPTLPQMRQALRSREFRERVQRYIDTVARGGPSVDKDVRGWEQRRIDEYSSIPALPTVCTTSVPIAVQHTTRPP
jgi:hypothetical protein